MGNTAQPQGPLVVGIQRQGAFDQIQRFGSKTPIRSCQGFGFGVFNHQARILGRQAHGMGQGVTGLIELFGGFVGATQQDPTLDISRFMRQAFGQAGNGLFQRRHAVVPGLLHGGIDRLQIRVEHSWVAQFGIQAHSHQWNQHGHQHRDQASCTRTGLVWRGDIKGGTLFLVFVRIQHATGQGLIQSRTAGIACGRFAQQWRQYQSQGQKNQYRANQPERRHCHSSSSTATGVVPAWVRVRRRRIANKTPAPIRNKAGGAIQIHKVLPRMAGR